MRRRQLSTVGWNEPNVGRFDWYCRQAGILSTKCHCPSERSVANGIPNICGTKWIVSTALYLAISGTSGWYGNADDSNWQTTLEGTDCKSTVNENGNIVEHKTSTCQCFQCGSTDECFSEKCKTCGRVDNAGKDTCSSNASVVPNVCYFTGKANSASDDTNCLCPHKPTCDVILQESIGAYNNNAYNNGRIEWLTCRGTEMAVFNSRW